MSIHPYFVPQAIDQALLVGKARRTATGQDSPEENAAHGTSIRPYIIGRQGACACDDLDQALLVGATSQGWWQEQ